MPGVADTAPTGHAGGMVARPPIPDAPTAPHAPTAARSVVFVAFDDMQVLDLAGPHEVFALANRFAVEAGEPPPYALDVRRAISGDPSERTGVRSSGGLVVLADAPLGRPGSRANRSIDTLVVVGGNGVVDAAAAVVPWLAAVAPRCRRVTSVCSGSFLLAAAGLLDGRRATCHWTACDLLADRFPAVEVDPDPIFIRDGHVWTSAGVTAGIDLALALVEDDLGPEVTRAVARHLVMFVQRPGGQAQFSTHLRSAPARRSPLRELQAWIADHPEADLTVPVLADRVHMSVRHFSRVFRDEVGVTPAEFVERTRVEAARHRLESSDAGVEAVARACGFGTPETLQRSFRRVVGVTPTEYRRHFLRTPA